MYLQAFVVVGDYNGHVGLGVKCAKEVCDLSISMSALCFFPWAFESAAPKATSLIVKIHVHDCKFVPWLLLSMNM